MFKGRTGHLEITRPTDFNVRYVGFCETETITGKNRSIPVLAKIWSKCPADDELVRVRVSITSEGITVRVFDPKTASLFEPLIFKLEDISYACVDRSQGEDLIFSWLVNSVRGLRSRECHAVLCYTTDQARSMEECMVEVFRAAKRKELQRRRGQSSKSRLVSSISTPSLEWPYSWVSAASEEEPEVDFRPEAIFTRSTSRMSSGYFPDNLE